VRSWRRAAHELLRAFARHESPFLVATGFLPAVIHDFVRVALLSVPVDRARRREGPAAVIARMRFHGKRARRRPPPDRARLKSLISLVDSLFPSGRNCYRRVLLEVALDAGAAEEPVYFALRSGGGAGTGHAYLASDGHPDTAYDAVFTM
jgi:hypothetical protein